MNAVVLPEMILTSPLQRVRRHNNNGAIDVSPLTVTLPVDNQQEEHAY